MGVLSLDELSLVCEMLTVWLARELLCLFWPDGCIWNGCDRVVLSYAGQVSQVVSLMLDQLRPSYSQHVDIFGDAVSSALSFGVGDSSTSAPALLVVSIWSLSYGFNNEYSEHLQCQCDSCIWHCGSVHSWSWLDLLYYCRDELIWQSCVLIKRFIFVQDTQ